MCEGISAKCIDTYDLGEASPAEVKELQEFILDVLDSSLNGKFVKDAFKKNVVTAKIREMLQTIIITHIQSSCVNHKISPNKFKYLALAKAAAFPGENRSIYYVPNCTRRSIVSKYQYRIKLFKRPGFFEKQSKLDSISNSDPANLLLEPGG